MVEARVTRTGPLGSVGIDLVEVRDHSVDRGVEAVEIQAVEADHPLSHGQRVVPVAKPGDELDDVGVPPHPGRESTEVGERLLGGCVVALAPDEPIDAIGVRPVAFDRHGVYPASAIRRFVISARSR